MERDEIDILIQDIKLKKTASKLIRRVEEHIMYSSNKIIFVPYSGHIEVDEFITNYLRLQKIPEGTYLDRKKIIQLLMDAVTPD